MFIQNFTGIAIAAMTDMELSTGILGGSVSLSGGHGTAIAWAAIFKNQYHVKNAIEIGIACATFGLILGGVIGGSIAKYLINRYDLRQLEKNNPPTLLAFLSVFDLVASVT